jgi:hypothetical protein
MLRAGGVLLMVLVAVIASAVSCSGGPPHAGPARPGHVLLAARTRLPASATSVLAGAPDVVAEGVARALFASSAVAVVASPARPAGLAAAARSALRAHAPLLLTSAAGDANPAAGDAKPAAGRAAVSAVLRAQVRALAPRAVLAAGVPRDALAAALPGIRVVTDPAALPATRAPASLGHVALLIRSGASDAATAAAVTTARVAGVQVIAVHGADPRADPAAIAALSAIRPRQVLAVGAGFGPAALLASRIATAQTGVQLPGGGQVLFPMRMLVALYGHPGAPALGVLGRQGLQASIARARHVAAAYQSLSRVPVIPAMEIIATVAEGRPGYDGSYSYQAPVSFLRPWVLRATAAGMYVILDLQPGRASLLAQARNYQSLLELPDVGLALDPEWKLQPGQVPLHQIGGVSIGEVNSVIGWLSGLTARYRLPQKLLVLHQFRLSMIRGERELDTRHDDLSILIHMDGQGSQGDKRQTWQAVTGAAPPGVYFGWKNFYLQDHPMMTPRQTMARTPPLSMVSYQ